MSGFRVLSEQYPMAQNYSPFKYVTLIFKLLLFFSLCVKIATIGVLKVSLGKACQIFNRGSVLFNNKLLTFQVRNTNI